MTHHDPHQPMRQAVAAWRQHIIEGGNCTPGEYPPIQEAAASFRAESENTAQRLISLMPGAESHTCPTPSDVAGAMRPGTDVLSADRAKVRRRKALSRYTRKGYGRALAALEGPYPQHVQAIRDYTACLHDEIAAARIEARHLRAQVEGDRDE